MKKLLPFFMLIPLLTGCSHFKPAKLHKKTYAHATGIFASPTIDAKATLLNDVDLSPTARAITQDLELISLSIKNKTATPLYIEATSCTPHPVDRRALDAMTPKSYGCYFIPATALALGGILFTWQIGLPLAGAFTLFGVEQSRRAADRTLTSFTAHLLDNEHPVLLAPQSTTTMLVAIRKDEYVPRFDFVVSTDSKQKTSETNEAYVICSVPLYKSIDTSYTLI